MFPKLDRDTNAETACLVAYQRPDVVGPKFSKYVLSAVPDPASLEAALAMSNGILGKVEKQRDVFIASRKNLKARIHIDVVKHLGTYMEFEVHPSRLVGLNCTMLSYEQLNVYIYLSIGHR